MQLQRGDYEESGVINVESKEKNKDKFLSFQRFENAIRFWVENSRADPRAKNLIRKDLQWFKKWEDQFEAFPSIFLAQTMEPHVAHFTSGTDTEVYRMYLEDTTLDALTKEQFMECKPPFMVSL